MRLRRGSRRPASSRISASCGTRAGTFGGPGSFAKSLPTTSHSGSSAPSPGNDLLKLRWKPEVRVKKVFTTAGAGARAAEWSLGRDLGIADQRESAEGACERQSDTFRLSWQ